MAYVNHGGNEYSEVNCALCTVAAIFNTDTIKISQSLGLKGHQPEASFAIAYMRVHGIKEPAIGETQLNYELSGIMEFVESLKKHLGDPIFVSQGGSFDTPVPLNTQIKLMNSYPISTQFAVWACLADMKGLGAHWNYAKREDKGVKFYDYQYNDAEDHPPVTSDKFIPPKGNTDEVYTRAIVLVFRSTGTKMPYE